MTNLFVIENVTFFFSCLFNGKIELNFPFFLRFWLMFNILKLMILIIVECHWIFLFCCKYPCDDNNNQLHTTGQKNQRKIKWPLHDDDLIFIFIQCGGCCVDFIEIFFPLEVKKNQSIWTKEWKKFFHYKFFVN